MFLINRQWLKQAAFRLHQSTEQFFAGTRLVCTNYLPKSHDIEKLGKLCSQIDSDFATISPAIGSKI
ncbi:hypothetical protein [Vibrio spartinae]|uniref:hypothetical protein n=1 Tax=Vibrio spartinae TaxID=1918945 RepID=UPI000945219B|nr:hypothetical protein [Vibrio spartinae]